LGAQEGQNGNGLRLQGSKRAIFGGMGENEKDQRKRIEVKKATGRKYKNKLELGKCL
jgi:hypothetical protein